MRILFFPIVIFCLTIPPASFSNDVGEANIENITTSSNNSEQIINDVENNKNYIKNFGLKHKHQPHNVNQFVELQLLPRISAVEQNCVQDCQHQSKAKTIVQKPVLPPFQLFCNYNNTSPQVNAPQQPASSSLQLFCNYDNVTQQSSVSHPDNEPFNMQQVNVVQTNLTSPNLRKGQQKETKDLKIDTAGQTAKDECYCDKTKATDNPPNTNKKGNLIKSKNETEEIKGNDVMVGQAENDVAIIQSRNPHIPTPNWGEKPQPHQREQEEASTYEKYGNEQQHDTHRAPQVQADFEDIFQHKETYYGDNNQANFKYTGVAEGQPMTKKEEKLIITGKSNSSDHYPSSGKASFYNLLDILKELPIFKNLPNHLEKQNTLFGPITSEEMDNSLNIILQRKMQMLFNIVERHLVLAIKHFLPIHDPHKFNAKPPVKEQPQEPQQHQKQQQEQQEQQNQQHQQQHQAGSYMHQNLPHPQGQPQQNFQHDDKTEPTYPPVSEDIPPPNTDDENWSFFSEPSKNEGAAEYDSKWMFPSGNNQKEEQQKIHLQYGEVEEQQKEKQPHNRQLTALQQQDELLTYIQRRGRRLEEGMKKVMDDENVGEVHIDGEINETGEVTDFVGIETDSTKFDYKNDPEIRADDYTYTNQDDKSKGQVTYQQTQPMQPIFSQQQTQQIQGPQKQLLGQPIYKQLIPPPSQRQSPALISRQQLPQQNQQQPLQSEMQHRLPPQPQNIRAPSQSQAQKQQSQSPQQLPPQQPQESLQPPQLQQPQQQQPQQQQLQQQQPQQQQPPKKIPPPQVQPTSPQSPEEPLSPTEVEAQKQKEEQEMLRQVALRKFLLKFKHGQDISILTENPIYVMQLLIRNYVDYTLSPYIKRIQNLLESVVLSVGLDDDIALDCHLENGYSPRCFFTAKEKYNKSSDNDNVENTVADEGKGKGYINFKYFNPEVDLTKSAEFNIGENSDYKSYVSEVSNSKSDLGLFDIFKVISDVYLKDNGDVKSANFDEISVDSAQREADDIFIDVDDCTYDKNQAVNPGDKSLDEVLQDHPELSRFKLLVTNSGHKTNCPRTYFTLKDDKLLRNAPECLWKAIPYADNQIYISKFLGRTTSNKAYSMEGLKEALKTKVTAKKPSKNVLKTKNTANAMKVMDKNSEHQRSTGLEIPVLEGKPAHVHTSAHGEIMYNDNAKLIQQISYDFGYIMVLDRQDKQDNELTEYMRKAAYWSCLDEHIQRHPSLSVNILKAVDNFKTLPLIGKPPGKRPDWVGVKTYPWYPPKPSPTPAK